MHGLPGKSSMVCVGPPLSVKVPSLKLAPSNEFVVASPEKMATPDLVLMAQ